MIPTDAVLLGIVIVGFIAAIPLGIAVTGLLLWASARSKKTGRRAF